MAPARSATNVTEATFNASPCGTPAMEWDALMSERLRAAFVAADCALPCRSFHRFLDQFVGSFRQQDVGSFAVNRLAPDIQHDRDRQGRDPVERLMDDSPLDAREHFGDPADVEQA